MFRLVEAHFSRLWSDQEGATMVEYALMLGLIVGLVGAIATVISGKTSNAMNKTNNVMVGF